MYSIITMFERSVNYCSLYFRNIQKSNYTNCFGYGLLHMFIVTNINCFLTVAEVIEFIKGKLDYPPNVPLYFYINGIIPSMNSTMGELYQEYRESDYLLYIGYYEENIYSTS